MAPAMMNYWILDEALPLIRALQPLTRQYGYHLCLGGGVLNKGESKKDLDLYFLTLDSGKSKSNELIAFLSSMWGTATDLMNGYPTEEGSLYEFKLKYNYNGLRIDVFVI